MSLLWRVYYGDGSVADNLSHSFVELPAWDVQVIVQRDEKHNRNVPTGADYYLYHTRDMRWYPVDFTGLIDYLAHDFRHVGAVLFGRYIPSRDYDATYKRALADADFLPESAAAPRF